MATIKPLSKELQKIAIEECGEVPARVPDDLLALKTWIKQQSHLRVRMDDQLLIQFLRGCKYSIERAKEKLDIFYSLKSKFPEIFGACDVDEPRFREIHNLGCFTCLPKPLNDTGPRIIVINLKYDPSKYTIDNIYYPGCAMLELLMYNDPNACIQGMVYIVDFGKATASHFLQMTPSFCKKAVSFLEKSMPSRIRAAYFINTGPATQQLFKMLFPFFSEKLRSRFHVIGRDLKELQKHIPLAYLPREYGGENSSCIEAAKDYNKTWDANRNYFKENAQFGSDESLRPGKPLDIEGLFGLGGSFRKLAVD